MSNDQLKCVGLLVSLVLALFAQGEGSDDTIDKRVLPAGRRYKENACAYGVLKSQGDVPNVNIPRPSWLQTPSIVEISSGHYQALGRVINAKYLLDYLKTQKNVDFKAARADIKFLKQLDILADTLYIKDKVIFYGIKKVKIFARQIVAAQGSMIGVVTPNWSQKFSNPTETQANGDGTNGENGKDGLEGPQVEIICDAINGTFEVVSKGGDGHKGQDGGSGRRGADNHSVKYDYQKGICGNSVYAVINPYQPWLRRCQGRSRKGLPGNKGENGGKGGNAGKPGKGGNAGRITLRYEKQNGQTTLKTCGGTGAQPAKNGQGGKGGKGGRGGLGVTCDAVDIFGGSDLTPASCGWKKSERGPRGAPGTNGAPGSTQIIQGRNGTVSGDLIQYGTLDAASKNNFPSKLLEIMRRQAVDLLMGNSNNRKGRDILHFIVKVATGRSDVIEIMKDAQRKLVYLNVKGFDMFGRNCLFAPLMRWESFKKDIEDIKKAAETYQKAFNDILRTVKNQDDLRKMAGKFSKMSSKQVKAQKERLIDARRVDLSEKRMYVHGIKTQEQKMTGILQQLKNLLPSVHEAVQNKINKEHLIAILQGVTGFASGILSKDPLALINTALEIWQYDINRPCLKSLDTIKTNIKKWMTFGKAYKALRNSSDLNFDQVQVAKIPEIMKANLDISKEKLTADLVCLLEEASRPRQVAAVKAEIESYFIVGGARIEMIGKVVELDNKIGTHNFDIPLLQKTENEISEANKTQGGSLSTDLRQTFTDNLLSTYKQLERSFMEKLYELQNALGFRFLWNLHGLIGSFQRIASENALGVRRLNGAVQLTRELRKLNNIIQKARMCFTKHHYITDVHKWSFDQVKNKQMFEQLKKGNTTFNISKDQICPTCYNARLIKMYIELYGSEPENRNVPRKVHLKVRHLSESYFRAGNNSIVGYLQPIVNSYRHLKFNRFTISDKDKCNQASQQGKTSKYCVEENDRRLKPMCDHPLNGRPRTGPTMGRQECTSPSGYYELLIPVDKNLDCLDPRMKNKNCKDLDLNKFTNMNVWVYYVYWARYPLGPDDPICRGAATLKRNQTEIVREQFPAVLDGNKR